MQPKEFQLNDNASFIFPYSNAVYKVTLNVENGVIILEELKKYQKKRDIKNIITLPDNEPSTEVMEVKSEDTLT